MSPVLPALTPLQFVVLGVLLVTEQRGIRLREELARHRVRRTGPAFYQMMARLEDAGWVDGFYTQRVEDGQMLKERWYRITSPGTRAWTDTRDFYAETAARLGRPAGVAHA
jgi:DNA-binding PadR family transcriptional regulator